jgi:opacity protein-like surface antigen
MRWCVLVFAIVAMAPPAAAQSTYVGGSLVVDIARFSRIDYDDDFARILADEPSLDGEALGFNVKVGRTIGERWGVEFEFARSGELESRNRVVTPLVRERLDLVIPPLEFEYSIERSHLTLGALAFIRQDLGDRLELSYLAGIAFNRVETDRDIEVSLPIQIFPVVDPDFAAIEYGVGPSVGLEAAFTFGSAALTGGVRLQTAGESRGSWLIRPNVGLRWTF